MACGKRDAVLENGGDLFCQYFKCLIFHNFWKIRYSSKVFPTWNKLQTSIIIGFWEKWRKIKHTVCSIRRLSVPVSLYLHRVVSVSRCTVQENCIQAWWSGVVNIPEYWKEKRLGGKDSTEEVTKVTGSFIDIFLAAWIDVKKYHAFWLENVRKHFNTFLWRSLLNGLQDKGGLEFSNVFEQLDVDITKKLCKSNKFWKKYLGLNTVNQRCLKWVLDINAVNKRFLNDRLDHNIAEANLTSRK